MLNWILFGIFIAIETLLFVFVWVIRYHFKMFGLPNDTRGIVIQYALILGNLVLFFATGAALFFIFRNPL